MTGHLNHITKHEAVPDFTNPAIDFAPLIAQQYCAEAERRSMSAASVNFAVLLNWTGWYSQQDPEDLVTLKAKWRVSLMARGGADL